MQELKLLLGSLKLTLSQNSKRMATDLELKVLNLDHLKLEFV
jgi:hypothetical protein